MLRHEVNINTADPVRATLRWGVRLWYRRSSNNHSRGTVSSL